MGRRCGGSAGEESTPAATAAALICRRAYLSTLGAVQLQFCAAHSPNPTPQTCAAKTMARGCSFHYSLCCLLTILLLLLLHVYLCAVATVATVLRPCSPAC